MKEGPVKRYWSQFLSSRSWENAEAIPDLYDSFYFGTKPEDASGINPLVLSGVKTATGSVLWAYEAEGKRPPQASDYSIVTDGEDQPICVIQTTEVRIIPYDEVDETWAYYGGEGDRTLATWQKDYWSYILWECARIGREPTSKIPMVLERFQVVYREPLSSS